MRHSIAARAVLSAALTVFAGGFWGLGVLLGSEQEASASTGCSALAAQATVSLNSTFIGTIAPISLGTFTFAPGDVITYGPITAGGVSSSSLTGGGISLSTALGAVKQTITTAITTALSVNATTTAQNSFVTVTCSSAGGSASTPVNLASPAIQSVNNAQQSISMGQTTLRNLVGFTGAAVSLSFTPPFVISNSSGMTMPPVTVNVPTISSGPIRSGDIPNNTVTMINVTPPGRPSSSTFTLGGSVVSVVGNKITAVNGVSVVGGTLTLLKGTRGALYVGIEPGNVNQPNGVRVPTSSVTVENGAILINNVEGLKIPGSQSELQAPGSLGRQSTLAALDWRVRDLKEQVADLRTEGASANDPRLDALDQELTVVLHDLAFARLEAMLEEHTGRQKASASPPGDDGPIGGAVKPATAPSELHLNARQFVDACDFSCDSAPPKWNVWLEGRTTGVNDTLALASSLGFVGAAGADYKVLPWLTLGMGFSVETSQSNSGPQGARMSALGLSVLPYVGFKIDDNLTAAVFVGVTNLNYNSSPAPGVSAQFSGTRFMAGGSLTGTWHDGAWRFQPGFSGSFGTETQYGYTDTAGNVVPGQVVSFGRLEAGPEIGYTFSEVRPGVSVEPFVSLRAVMNFASDTMAISSAGVPIVVRPGTAASGSSGAGLSLRAQNGFFLRALASYDSIGVSGLDVWSGVLRGGFTF